MYLYYKQLITGTSLQASILSLSIKYLWLTSYFSLLLKKNINNTQLVKKYSNHLLGVFSYKVQSNKYLACMLNAFNYSLAINTKIIDFITAPKTELDRELGIVKDLAPIPTDKKGAQF